MSPGDSQPIDVCSVHHNNTFLRYSVSLLGYGFYGDLLIDSERKRWMGPTRYDFSGRQPAQEEAEESISPALVELSSGDGFCASVVGVKTFLSHHYYEGTVSFLPVTDNLASPRDKLKCRSG